MLMLNLSDRLAFVAIRIHALWSRNRYILVSLFLLGMINPATIVTVRRSFLFPPNRLRNLRGSFIGDGYLFY